ncbi:MAG: GYDIA family GHMP kinase [Flavobacteriales bacterium]
MNFTAHGKLLLTGEYAITQSALGIAMPTSFGQHLSLESYNGPEHVLWEALDHKNQQWFTAGFDHEGRLLHCSSAAMAEKLQGFLAPVRNSNAWNAPVRVQTKVDFPRLWGLGTSSTLCVLLAQWAEIDALSYRELHGGSGYDLACAQATGAISYALKDGKPEVDSVQLPQAMQSVVFVYRGAKQQTDSSLKLVGRKPFSTAQCDEISALSEAFLKANSQDELESIIEQHELLIANHLGLERAIEGPFKGIHGQVKSLGGWGGDFVMLTRLEENRQWLEANAFNTIIPFETMAL